MATFPAVPDTVPVRWPSVVATSTRSPRAITAAAMLATAETAALPHLAGHRGDGDLEAWRVEVSGIGVEHQDHTAVAGRLVEARDQVAAPGGGGPVHATEVVAHHVGPQVGEVAVGRGG